MTDEEIATGLNEASSEYLKVLRTDGAHEASRQMAWRRLMYWVTVAAKLREAQKE